MSTKRRIPINNHETGPDGTAPESAASETTVSEATAPGSTGADTGPGPEASAGTTDAQGAEASAELDALKAERDELSDTLLRLRAEFENFRKRSVRELVESRERAQGELLNDLLPVLDNLERALDAAEHHDEGKVLGGVRMTRDMFVDLLRRTGVEEIETDNVPFDPAVHEAMLVQPSELEEGSITAVLQKGYRQGQRVLRPARVAVSSGPQAASDQAG